MLHGTDGIFTYILAFNDGECRYYRFLYRYSSPMEHLGAPNHENKDFSSTAGQQPIRKGWLELDPY